MKILWLFLDEKIPPSPVTGKIVSVQWREHKFSFWMINYMPPNQKKGVKRLLRDQNTSILGQALWKQTEAISLIFNRSETVESYIGLVINLRGEKEWGLENSHMCNLKNGTLRSLKIIGGAHASPCPPPVPTALKGRLFRRSPKQRTCVHIVFSIISFMLLSLTGRFSHFIPAEKNKPLVF